MSNSSSSGGIGLGTVLLVIFIALKLAEVGWFSTASWWWAPAFALGPFVAVMFAVTLVAVFGFLSIVLFKIYNSIFKGRNNP